MWNFILLFSIKKRRSLIISDPNFRPFPQVEGILSMAQKRARQESSQEQKSTRGESVYTQRSFAPRFAKCARTLFPNQWHGAV